VVTLGRAGGGLVAVEAMVSEGCMLAFAFVDRACEYVAEGYAWRNGDAAGHTKMRTLHWHYCFLQREAPHAFGYATLFVDPVACAGDGLCRTTSPPGACPALSATS